MVVPTLLRGATIGRMTTGTGITHLYATVRYKGQGSWVGETAQFGVRMGVFFGDTLPALTEGNVTLPTHSVDTTFSVDTSVTGQRREYNFTNTSGSTAYSTAFQGLVLDKVLTFAASIKTYLQGYALQDVRLYPCKGDGTIPAGMTPTIMEPTAATWNPSGTGVAGPPEVALCLSWSSAVRARSGRGRVYLGPLALATCAPSEGLVAAPVRNAIATAGATLISNLRGISSTAGQATACPIIWHRGTNVAGVILGGDTGAVINLARVDDRLDSQKRRQKQHTPVWTDVTVT